MTLEKLTRHLSDAYGAEAEHAFQKYPEIIVFRRADNRKWFALVNRLPCRKLGLDRAGEVDILNVKCDPILLGSLRGKRGYLPAWHMNKTHWNSVRADGNVPDDLVRGMLDKAYSIVLGGMSRKRQREILGEDAGENG